MQVLYQFFHAVKPRILKKVRESYRFEHAPLHLLIGRRYGNATVFGQRELIEHIDQQPPRNNIGIEEGVILKPVRKHKK